MQSGRTRQEGTGPALCFQATATYSVVRAHNLLWCGGDTGLEGRQEGLMEILLAHFSVEVVPGVTVRSFQRV